MTNHELYEIEAARLDAMMQLDLGDVEGHERVNREFDFRKASACALQNTCIVEIPLSFESDMMETLTATTTTTTTTPTRTTISELQTHKPTLKEVLNFPEPAPAAEQVMIGIFEGVDADIDPVECSPVRLHKVNYPRFRQSAWKRMKRALIPKRFQKRYDYVLF